MKNVPTNKASSTNDTSGAIIASADSRQFSRGWSGPSNPKGRPGQKPVVKAPSVEVLPPAPDDPRLVELATEIRAAVEAFGTHTMAAIEAVIRAGEKLGEAKRLAGHGKFLAWVATNCALSERSVQDYLRIYEHRDQIRVKYAAFAADFSMRSALKTLATPRVNGEDRRLEELEAERKRLRAQERSAAAALQAVSPTSTEIVEAGAAAGVEAHPHPDVAEGAGDGAELHQAADTDEDLIARRRHQLVELEAAWERADSAVRQTFRRQINAECATEWPSDD